MDDNDAITVPVDPEVKAKANNRDHDLMGGYQGCRECHVKSDLLRVYVKDAEYLTLTRLGTHSELFK